MTRRRALTLAAGFACAPRVSRAAERWTGTALGADVSVSLDGPEATVREGLARVPQLLAEVERTFSLYLPESELSRLNASGRLDAPSAMMWDVIAQVDRVHEITGGLFDPTVQPLWRALAFSGDPDAARPLIGWDRVETGAGIVLDAGQALTLNGIVLGYATDLVWGALRELGAERALISLGEQAALGGPYRLPIEDPAAGTVGWRSLRDSAVATSAPAALLLDEGQGHILAPDGSPPIWSSVSIEAESATMADAISTVAVFLGFSELQELMAVARLGRITLVGPDGQVHGL
ncbi:FAD:protein FMN transferase [Litorisediminicola beolgyonensis]|uniref:FAD:protein FMN transferase n=1 Tax=Litorisediminicola beolgyonensis TaxID=1173614 RepID=A0ABW3ZK02_9RHOB